MYFEQVLELLKKNPECLSDLESSKEGRDEADINEEVHYLIRDLVMHMHEQEQDLKNSILVFLPTYRSLEQQWLFVRHSRRCFKVLESGTLTLNKLSVDKNLIEVFVKDVDKDHVVLLAARASRTEDQDAIDANGSAGSSYHTKTLIANFCAILFWQRILKDLTSAEDLSKQLG